MATRNKSLQDTLENTPRVTLGPCSTRQRMVLMDQESDILIQGGSKLVLPR